MFNNTGLNKVEDEVLKHLVIARIPQPRSKVATVDYLKKILSCIRYIAI